MGTDPAIPCGLVAKSFFNDKYVLYDGNNNVVPISSTGIAWESDVQYKFKNTYDGIPAGKNWQNIQWLDMTDGKRTKLCNWDRALHRVDAHSRPA